MTTVAGRGEILRSRVNEKAAADAQAFFAQCDGAYERKVDDIVRKIGKDTEASKVIMLSGPSASGKTTTSMKIMQGLESRGIRAVTISMDDFFKGRDDVPRLPDGSQDFESVNALDVGLFKQVLLQLTTKGAADLPVFNFKRGMRDETLRHLELGQGSVAIVEGLHALNPAMVDGISGERLLRIYVSVSSDFRADDRSPVLTARDVRLVRRMVRDFNFRGSSPENTLEMWNLVCEGEDRYVRPFKRNADIVVNSVYACEPCLFRAKARELFAAVGPQSPYYEAVGRLSAAIESFEEMELSLVPSSCMLREFFGGSIYFNKSARK